MENKKNTAVLPISYISALCMEISMLLKAGMPLDQGILSMIDDEKTEDGKKLLSSLYESLESGSSFSAALSSTGLFPDYMSDMVNIGEQTGELENVLYELYTYYKKEEELRAGIKNAVLYPLIMVGMMFVVLMVLVLKILPMFNEVYYAMGSSVPPAAIIIMKAGNAVSIAALIAIAVFIVCFAASFIYSRATGGKRLFGFINNILQNSSISELIAVSRFTSVISMAVSSGLELDYAMDLANRLVTNKKVSEKILKCKELLDSGESFSDCIEQTALIRGTYAGLLNIGFKTGSTDTVMKELSERYSQEVDSKITSIVSSIEPSLVIVLSILVGVILLLVMMPLMGIMSSI